MGVTGPAALRYLDGSRVPDATALARLHASTNVDLNWLLNDEDFRPGPILVRRRRQR